MTSIILSSHTKALAFKYSNKLVEFGKNDDDSKILGPVEAPLSLLRGKYRYRILLKGKSRKKLNQITRNIIKKAKLPSSVRVIIDVDPYTFM